MYYFFHALAKIQLKFFTMQFEIRDLGARRFQDATIFAPSNGDTILRHIGLPHAELFVKLEHLFRNPYLKVRGMTIVDQLHNCGVHTFDVERTT